MSDVLVSVDGVSKKFCKSLKRSMLYGIKDIGRDMLGVPPRTEELRAGEFWSVDNVSFEVKRGECLGLIGPNGAGKSTLLKILNGIIAPDKGRIEIKGRVGALIEVTAGFHPMLTGRENIYINGTILGFSKKEIDKKFDEIVEFSELGDFIDSPVKHYSSGMNVRLGFAIAAQMEPDVLLIDEVLSVGDVGFRTKCLNAIDKILRNAAIIFVSHQISQVARISSSILLINHGRTVFQDNDVTKGIECYYSQYKQIKGNISGSGRAIIHNINFSSVTNNNVTNDEMFTIRYLDDLYVYVSFSMEKEVKNAIMNIGFLDREMRGIAQCYSCSSNFEVTNLDKRMFICITIPNLQLNPGVYSISISIVDGNRGEIFTHHFAVKNIQVIGSFIGMTPILLQGEWAYCEDNPNISSKRH